MPLNEYRNFFQIKFGALPSVAFGILQQPTSPGLRGGLFARFAVCIAFVEDHIDDFLAEQGRRFFCEGGGRVGIIRSRRFRRFEIDSALGFQRTEVPHENVVAIFVQFSFTQAKKVWARRACSGEVAPFTCAAPVQTMNRVEGKALSLVLRALY